MADKISIIVPVFNTATYLGKCVESILLQTYHNLEIIIVDDGSTDESPIVCDLLKQRDSRIKIFHKENGGASSARNKGIDESSGDYIMFVDSDDILALDIVEQLLIMIKNAHCDISMCGYYTSKDHSDIPLSGLDSTHNILMTGAEALSNILYQKNIGSGSVWGKLYRASLLKTNRFIANIAFAEDLEMNSRLLLEADSVTYNPIKKYFYIQHSNSVTESGYSTKRSDALTAIQIILNRVQGYPELKKAAERRLFIDAFAIVTLILRKGISGSGKEYAYCIDLINQYKWELLKDKNAAIRHRIAAGMAIISSKLLIRMYGLTIFFKTRLSASWLRAVNKRSSLEN